MSELDDTIPALPSIFDYVAHYAAVMPDAEALVGDGRRLTYGDLLAEVDAMAKALIAAGVGPGDRVSMLSTPHPLFWINFLAAASIGAIWHGLNPRYRREELEYVVGDSDPGLILARTRIGDRSYVDDLAALARVGREGARRVVGIDSEGTGVEPLAGFMAAAAGVSDAALAEARQGVGGRQPCLLVYTSGTTGRPKGALLHHHGLIRTNTMRLRFARAWPMRVVTFLPINHVGCVGDTGCTVLLSGGCLILMEQFDARASLETMAAEKATAWGSVPTTFQLCLDLPDFERFDLSALQLITWGGARMPRELIPRLRQLCPNLATDYGMTETIGSVSYTEPGDSDEVLSETVGRPAPGFEIRIANDGVEAEPGEAGEVQVRGDFVMLGYWRREAATAETIDSEGWLHTGDLAVRRPDGRLSLIGRLSEMYKSGGYNVYPKEVEAVLESLPSVASAAVLGAPDPLYGEAGHAFVVVEPGAGPTAEHLAAACRQRLANYKIPKRFHFVESLPLLAIGKVDKQALKARIVQSETVA